MGDPGIGLGDAPRRRAKPMNSVVHTGVKSAGWEMSTSHLPFGSMMRIGLGY